MTGRTTLEKQRGDTNMSGTDGFTSMPSGGPGNKTPEDVYGSMYSGWTWEQWSTYQRDRWKTAGSQLKFFALWANAYLWGKTRLIPKIKEIPLLGRCIPASRGEIAGKDVPLTVTTFLGTVTGINIAMTNDTAFTFPENWPPRAIPPFPENPLEPKFGLGDGLLSYPIVVDPDGNGIKTIGVTTGRSSITRVTVSLKKPSGWAPVRACSALTAMEAGLLTTGANCSAV